MANTNIENIREIMSNDPFSIKKSLIDLADKHLGVYNIDTYEVGFMGYFIQALTLLTSDVMFNTSIAFNEAFTHLLILPTSLQNHANMLDYNLNMSKPCEGNITIYVPIPESGSYQLTLKNGTKCDGDSQYLIKNTYYINVNSNNTAKVQMKDALTGIISDIEYQNRISDGDKLISFLANVWQIDITTIPIKFTNVQYKEFYDVNIAGIKDLFYDINIGVYVQDDNLTIPRLLKFNKVNSIYSCTPRDKSYTFKYYGDGRGTIRFGNGVFGYQPKEGTSANILIYSTKGSSGKTYPGGIELNTKLLDFYTNEQVNIYGVNTLTIDNGEDEENIEVAKSNIIANISSAKRLVTSNDYNNFEGICGLTNMEIYPMLLRRDSNVNEIDLFSILYDNDGKPIPTTNLNYMINKDRTLLSKDYVYKLAIKTGDMGMELVPNTIKVFDKYAFSKDDKTLYSAIYVDKDYDNFNNAYNEYDKKIRLLYNDNSIEVIKPEYIKEFVCPFNLSIEDIEKHKRGIFEYIPNNLNDVPQLQDQIEYIDIDMSLFSVQFDLEPISSMTKTNIQPTGIHVINNLNISDNVINESLYSYVRFVNENDSDSDEVLYSKNYECTCKFISTETNELQTDCIIPINDILSNDVFAGRIKFEYTIYYSNRYYNTYSRYITFRNKYEDVLLTNFIGYPISFTYDPADESTKQPEPAIDKVYISCTNVNITWTKWLDKDLNEYIDGYIVDVELNKLETVDLNKVQVTFDIGYDNQTFYPISDPSIYNDIKCIYSFKIPYNPKYIMDGSTYYTIDIKYRFNESDGSNGVTYSDFATYSGYLIFRRRFSDLMWCNIEPLENDETGDIYKVYRIPVIEKEYYENNKQYIEDNILHQLAELESKTIDYKMLTDRHNFKFAKTIGVTENLKYNDNVENVDESLKYNGWVCDLPPTIEVSVLVKRDSERSKQDIINDCKAVILSFLTIKSSFNAKIIRSELARFIHDAVSDVISCEVDQPSKDIIYFYEEDELPKDKDTLLSYNPEFLYIDADKIKVKVKQMPI